MLGAPSLDEPATEDGIDPSGGENAGDDRRRARRQDAEPDLRDAASGPPQSDIESAR